MTNRLFTENKNIKENVKNDIFLKQQVEKIKSDSEKFANKDIAALICTPKVRHFWRCIFLWQRKGKNIENTRQNSNYLL